MKKLLFLCLPCLFFFNHMQAQQDSISNSPVEDQFTNLMENSNDYQGYKVVDYNDLLQLKKNTTQFISDLNSKLTTQQNTINQQQEQIAHLKDTLTSTKQGLKTVNEEKDAITFLGMPFSKGSYKTLMWGIVAILIIALVFFIYKQNREHVQTAEARNKFYSTEKEFETYRAKSLEKEQRLGRLLQDERNKSGDI